MSDHRQTDDDRVLEGALREIFGERAPGPEHPAAAVLRAYRERALDEEQSDGVQEHLATCRACTARLLEATQTVTVATGAHLSDELSKQISEQISDEDIDRGIDETMALISREAHRPAALLVREQARSRPLVRSIPASRRWLAAAALLVWIGTLALLIESRRENARLGATLGDLTRPQAGVSVVSLLPPAFARGGSDGTVIVEAPRSSTLMVFVLTPDHEVRSQTQTLSLLDADDAEIWQGAVTSNRAGSFVVAIPRTLLPEGRFRLRIGSEELGLSEDYSFELRSGG